MSFSISIDEVIDYYIRFKYNDFEALVSISEYYLHKLLLFFQFDTQQFIVRYGLKDRFELERYEDRYIIFIHQSQAIITQIIERTEEIDNVFRNLQEQIRVYIRNENDESSESDNDYTK